MLNEEQQKNSVTIDASTAIVLLQCVTRLTTLGALRDNELEPVGVARNRTVQALDEATGVNYDEERAKAEVQSRQRLAQAKAEQAKAEQAKAEEVTDNDGESE